MVPFREKNLKLREPRFLAKRRAIAGKTGALNISVDRLVFPPYMNTLLLADPQKETARVGKGETCAKKRLNLVQPFP